MLLVRVSVNEMKQYYQLDPVPDDSSTRDSPKSVTQHRVFQNSKHHLAVESWEYSIPSQCLKMRNMTETHQSEEWQEWQRTLEAIQNEERSS